MQTLSASPASSGTNANAAALAQVHALIAAASTIAAAASGPALQAGSAPADPVGGSMRYVYDPGPQRPNKADDNAEVDELMAMAFALIASGALDAR